MANALYDGGRQRFLEGSIPWLTGSIKVALVRGYTVNLATHNFLSDITGAGGGTIVATSPNLSGKTSAAGVADANDFAFTAVTAGAACPHLIVYLDTGTPSTSPLISFHDTGTGLPITPGGGDINIAWDNGANRIFKL